MSNSNRQILVATITMALTGFAAAAQITRDAALESMQECQKQREENIAPLREQAIEECITNRRGDREYCERFNRTFGNAKPRAGGGMIPGMFWDFPDCQNAVAAQQFFRMNPSKQVYELP